MADEETPYVPTSELLRQVRDMYEIRDQYRHRAGGAQDPLEVLMRRFPLPR